MYLLLVAFLNSGALSLTVLTLNRVIGIVMPKLANTLKLNLLSVYSILAVVWMISFAAAAPGYFFRQYWVSTSRKWNTTKKAT